MRALLLTLVLTFVAVAATNQSTLGDVNGDGQDEVSEEEEVKLGEHLIIVSYSLVGLIGIAIWAERRHIPSSVAAIVVGSTLGLVMRLAGENSAPKTSAIHLLEYFNEEFFLYFLLPPIIFEAGFSLSNSHVKASSRRNLMIKGRR
jgi:phosphate/sulfate permease